ncbi:MAG: NAD(P)H-hydrate dehydratase [Butyrivibrio sp.]|nr:NAD(P)H-hydrate dehydratase [Acetatifactor muris]MCM1559241.1 NAD(P)H-hydrate dehydratase [Butyrivibrio sp.]
MKYLVTAEEMRRADSFTITEIGIPAVVLMERAALAALEAVEGYCREHPDAGNTVLVMAGVGNNGGDGLALARMLAEADFSVEVWIVGDTEKASEQWRQQRKILEHYSPGFCSNPQKSEYTILVDALFGVGLSREISGVFESAVERFNGLRGWKIALDVPSGVDSDTGRILGKDSVRADETLTFGFCKRGLALYPGCLAAGRVTTAHIGIPEAAFDGALPGMFVLDESPEELLPGRCPWGNKGTFGKVLLIAGSLNMAGAAVLAAGAAYRAGAGMVKVVTPAENREIIQVSLPEALVGTEEELASCFDWADVIAIGPGLGKSAAARQMLEKVISDATLPLLIDGDGLNLLAESALLRRILAEQGRSGRSIVLTPHVGELARLLGKEIPEIQENVAAWGRNLAMELQTVVAAKDARTFICKEGEPVCVNVSGNSGLATAGSGDVLAGGIAGLMAQGMEAYRAACVGVYLHGLAGDRAAAERGEHACMAGDLVKQGRRGGSGETYCGLLKIREK